VDYRHGDEVEFRLDDGKVRRGTVRRLGGDFDQLGVAYEEGITKVWVCLDDVEILESDDARIGHR